MTKQPITPVDLDVVWEYAEKCHRETNHLYDGKPYTVHLKMVRDNAIKFRYLLPDDHSRMVAIAGAMVHDVIEDTRQTYNDVVKICGVEVAEIAFALTNEKGRTRAGRANDEYYKGIRNIPLATYVKLCDRLANVRYSYEKGSSMYKVYQDEYESFRSKLYDETYDPMWDELERLLDYHNKLELTQ